MSHIHKIIQHNFINAFLDALTKLFSKNWLFPTIWQINVDTTDSNYDAT